MSSFDLSIAVLAAGKGTRLKLPYPKVLAPMLGHPMLHYVLQSLEAFIKNINVKAQVGVVTGFQSELVCDYLKLKSYSYPLKTAYQKEQNGTADAVRTYLEQVDQAKSTPLTLIVCGDTPLLQPAIFQQMWDELKRTPTLQAVAATFMASSPRGYGRILKAKDTSNFSIREEKDASAEEKKINEVNASLYLIKTEALTNFLKTVSNNNAAKEFYLTDIFQSHFPAKALCASTEEDFLGVNDQEQLEVVAKILQKRKIFSLRSMGVFIPDSQSTYIDWDVQVNAGATILPGCVLLGSTKVGNKSVLGPYAVLTNTVVHESARVHPFTVAQDAMIGDECEVGPMARLRPGANLRSHVKIGNFVEVKKSVLEKGSKVSHLSYIGDATIGEFSNIGCGFITCNYDGKNKHQTQIGARTFIGSDCQAIAPISIGSDCFIAAGSTLTENMPDGSFAIARSKQSTREGMAKRFLKSSESDKVSS